MGRCPDLGYQCMDKLENSFHDIAHVYYRFNNNEVYKFWLDFTLKHGNKPLNKVLDLACGNGEFIRRLAPYCQTITGIDYDPKMIDIAQRMTPSNDKIHYQCMNILDLSRLDRDFDLITCYLDSLCFLQNQTQLQEAINQVYQHLSPRGIFLFDVWSSKGIANFEDYYYFDMDDQAALLWESIVKTSSDNSQVSHQITVFEESMVQEGLYKKIQVELTERTYQLANYIDWLETAGFSKDKIEVFTDFDSEKLDDYDQAEELANERWFIKAYK